MRIEELILALKAGQQHVMETVFKNPPQNDGDFKKQLGFWMGLGEALRIIEEARRKEQNGDDD